MTAFITSKRSIASPYCVRDATRSSDLRGVSAVIQNIAFAGSEQSTLSRTIFNATCDAIGL